MREVGKLSGNNNYYEEDYVIPAPGVFFVFGSNRLGIHGAGAARAANQYCGAVYGVGEGPTGLSYAVPTKERPHDHGLPLSEIEKGVHRFVQYTLDNPDKTFLVTPIGTGYAGHHFSDIAPMFRGAINCWFPKAWEQFLI